MKSHINTKANYLYFFIYCWRRGNRGNNNNDNNSNNDNNNHGNNNDINDNNHLIDNDNHENKNDENNNHEIGYEIVYISLVDYRLSVRLLLMVMACESTATFQDCF